MMGTWMLVGPLLVVAFGGLAMMLVDAFTKDKAELSIMTAVTLGGAGSLSLVLTFLGGHETDQGMIGNYLSWDPLAHFLDLVICGGGALAALLAGGYLREHKIERGEFYVIMIFSAFGAMVLGRAVNLLSLFIGLETMSLGIYGLVAYRRASPRAAEGALKYFLLGSFASAVLLFGLALLYGATGEMNIVHIAQIIEAGDAAPNLLVLSMMFVVVGLAFKISAVPFHAWAPDAYEGAVTPATTFMAVVVKAAVFGVMLRVFFVAYSDAGLANAETGWPPAFAALAAITLLFGNLAALGQKSVKRMLAYSSISHAGFILVGFVAAWKLNGGMGESAVLYYLMAYTVSNVLAFGSLIAVGSYGKEAVSYDDLSGVGRRHPWIAVPFTLGILSLMGFPPTAGFFAKYYVILASVNAGGGMIWLAVIAVLASAVGAYYYLRVIVHLFMKSPAKGAPVAVPMKSGYVVAALVGASYFVVRMGVTPDSYLELVREVGEPGVEHIVDWTIFLYDAGVAVVLAAIAAGLSTMGLSQKSPAEEPAKEAA